ncbi:uncharacterized protein PADG_01541 [Paracoccidioides brasiliensis Pb18]|uniref:Uncharacterized protein n=1 Tax=Paracoccidioides brasiliensis (strain Pb18) TaxID=502780 RepID=C1G3M5_PARBD|nr:uncharacterized protein PADG_01541 [Paracoccidioides brasiliensis Pb18]EEH45391.2 hypothetical protein PADG_01541 [Paracoccidioides brasiliensis Pb18]
MGTYVRKSRDADVASRTRLDRFPVGWVHQESCTGRNLAAPPTNGLLLRFKVQFEKVGDRQRCPLERILQQFGEMVRVHMPSCFTGQGRELEIFVPTPQVSIFLRPPPPESSQSQGWRIEKGRPVQVTDNLRSQELTDKFR